jgi:signal peptide peptidase SppA
MVEGTAVVPIVGFLSPSGFMGTSVSQLRADVQSLASDKEVEAVLLWITSPGGSVAQIDELHGDLMDLRRHKAVHAYVEGLGASAAYWLASAATKITSNRTGQVGSLGVLTAVEDWSENYAKQGIKVHVIATSPNKGAGIEGTPIPAALLDEMREAVEYLGGIFMAAVRDGRSMTDDQVKALFTGRTWMAHRAREVGLIDGVGSLTEALVSLRTATKASRARRNLMNGF